MAGQPDGPPLVAGVPVESSGATNPDPLGDLEQTELLREVRLGLVMNGGVSLAVWMGGVTQEIDAVRRAGRVLRDDPGFEAIPGESGSPQRQPDSSSEPTRGLYASLLEALKERVVVDVIAGASAGGINGSLLATAVFAERRLPPLRDVWITVGDFSKLLRSPSVSEPKSLLRGDEFVLPQLRTRFEELLDWRTNGPADQPVYLYVTATDFYGLPEVFSDSTGRRFQELDHRHVFRFEHQQPRNGQIVPPPQTGEAMPPIGSFRSGNAAELLAQAARSSSSFPVAFEAHGLQLSDQAVKRWMIDGGVLDNQPFNPLLNRIATLSADYLPVRRVVGYIVPYVTEASAAVVAPFANGDPPVTDEGPAQPTAMSTQSAAGSLPRDLPKLQSLERLTRELSERRLAQQSRRRLRATSAAKLDRAANALYQSYRAMRYVGSLEVFAQWASPDFQPGAGDIAQLETLDRTQSTAPPVDAPVPDPPNPLPGDLPWLPGPEGRVWTPDHPWEFGLASSERIAIEALIAIGERLAKRPDWLVYRAAKDQASDLVESIRQAKLQVCLTFRDLPASGTLADRATAAYREAGVREMLTESFSALQPAFSAVFGRRLTLQRLINEEVVRNAASADQTLLPPPFDFVHMSAGVRNSLGHAAVSPDQKLAGMKLAHFAGFLKQSWRANDWLWGRLDGAEHILASLLDIDYLKTLARPSTAPLASSLATLAFPPKQIDALTTAWQSTLGYAVRRTDYETDVRDAAAVVIDEARSAGSDPKDQFATLLKAALSSDAHTADGNTTPMLVSRLLLDCCRAALAAPIQLAILAEELPKLEQAIQIDLDGGASRNTSGVEWLNISLSIPDRNTPANLATRFRDLTLGHDESPATEASSKLGLDVAATGVAVATAAFSGAGGGLPAIVRAPLATLRALTLVFAMIVRLLVRAPVLGIAVIIVATGTLIWGLLAPTTVLGALLPALLAIAIAGAAILLTMSTSPLEAPLRTPWRKGGYLLLIVIPAAALGVGLYLRSRLMEKVGPVAYWAAIALFAGALVAAIARLALQKNAKWRGITLWIYRLATLAALAFIVAGIVVEHTFHEQCSSTSTGWSCVAHRQAGAILFVVLIAAIALVPLVAALEEGIRWVVTQLRRRRKR